MHEFDHGGPFHPDILISYEQVAAPYIADGQSVTTGPSCLESIGAPRGAIDSSDNNYRREIVAATLPPGGPDDGEAPDSNAARPDAVEIVPPETPASIGGGDTPGDPPVDIPVPSGERPDDAPKFGVRHFDTDPRYATEPPVPGEALGEVIQAALITHARYVDPDVSNDGYEGKTVLLECKVPEGRVVFKVAQAGLNADFIRDDGTADRHDYFVGNAELMGKPIRDAGADGKVCRYDVNAAAGISDDLPAAGTLPTVEHEQAVTRQAEAELPNVAMDLDIGEGIRTVGSSQLGYVRELLEAAKPLPVSAAQLEEVAKNRAISTVAPQTVESVIGGRELAGYIGDALNDPASGYASFDEGSTFGGKIHVEYEGGSMDIEIGGRRHSPDVITPYASIIMKRPAVGYGADASGHPRDEVTRLSYTVRPRNGSLICRTDRGITRDVGSSGDNPAVDWLESDMVTADSLEARLLRNFLRDPHLHS